MTRRFRRVGTLAGLVAAFAAGGCDSPIAPDPARADIVGEEVIVRIAYADAEGKIYSLIVDRTRFLPSQPHSIDRVVQVRPAERAGEVEALRPGVGDRLRVSTRFLHLEEAGGLSPYVPDWPYDSSLKYRLGVHALTAVERVSP